MDPAASTSSKPLSTYTPQDDSSQFIRTFAKDFQASSGQTAVMGAPITKSKSEPENTTVTESGVSLQEFDLSPVNHADTSPKEHDAEVVELKQSDSDGIFGGWSTKKTTPAPSGTPHLPPAAPLTPVASVESDVDREAILARLRAKVSSERAVARTAPVVSDLPIRTGAPDFSSTPEPVLPTPKPPAQTTPAPSPIPETSSPLHTYSSDFASRIDSTKGSTFSVLAAQSDAGQTPRSSSPRNRTILPLLAGSAMLVVGIGAVLGAYFFTRQPTVPSIAGVPSLIQFDESVEVKGSGEDLLQSISNVGQGGIVSGNVIVTYTTLATTTGNSTPQPGGALIRDLGLTAPDILLRNIDDTSTVGVIRAGSESRPFMILKVTSYERTFAGMLAWEPTMRQNLVTLFPDYQMATNASGTPSVLSPTPTSFTDAVVANYDVRILRDASGRSVLLYGYRGKDTLIVARDETAFTALISRLRAAGS